MLHCLLEQAICSSVYLFLLAFVVKFIWLDLAYNVHDRAITGFNDTYYSVSKLNLLRLAYDGVCDVTQFFNGLNGRSTPFIASIRSCLLGLMAMP